MADRRADLLAALFLIWLSTRGGPAVNTAAFNVAADAARAYLVRKV